ncbi:MAG: ligase [Lacunisphaera sp.]|nr:ligase [Lacunisphaera sp.]
MARQDSGWFRELALASRLVLTGCLFGVTGVAVPLTRAEAVPPAINAAEAGERADALRAEIAHHDELYFKKSAPVISDSGYDQLKRELAALEQAYPQLAQGGAGVGDDRSGQFASSRHRQRMLSLSKSYTEAELRAFDARLMRQLGRKDLEYTVEPKFDGLAISVTFEQGRLVRAVTRGDGVEGDDVTANVLAIRGLPHLLRATSADGASNPIPEVIELRGEIYIGFAEFARINRDREGAGEAPFANPRNLASGTLKQLEPVESAQRRLEIVFYGHGACEPASIRPESQQALLRQLHAWGLPTIATPRIVHGADAVWAAVQAIGRERGGYAFPTDGAVVKLNDATLQTRLGETHQAPLWAMAYKFAPDRAQTQLKGITWQVGRTGVLTPVAELVPVQIGGSTVARASLFNRDEITRAGLRLGDFVYIEKAGEIIPAITGVNLGRRAAGSEPYVFPTECPGCHHALVQAAGTVAVRCPNAGCPAQVKRRVVHFASDAGVDIGGLGPAMVDKLVDQGGVRNVADLYRLRREDLLMLGANVEKSTDRLLAGIEQSKRAELWRFIAGLSIPQVGEVAAHELARRFGGLDTLACAERKDFQANGSMVGEATMTAVLAYFGTPENRAMVAALLDSGVRPAMAAPEAAGRQPLTGKIFVLTGTLPNLTRAQATARIMAAGGAVASSVTRRTDYVVMGEGSGAKGEAAHSLGITIIDEAELLRLVDGN